ncbi:MAG: hypothetical protein DRP15_02635, partial [Candidatus Aenigmatarchaeota archaeon]
MDETKTEMTSLDIRFLVKELREKLIGGYIRKIYQYANKQKQFLFEIFTPGKGEFWLYVDKDKMFITRRKKPVPLEPPSFCMFLRKYLLGKRIRNIRQYEFDRVVEIETDENILVFELVPPGNIILCDSSYNIIMPLEIQRWKTREVKPKVPYRHPPHRINPFEISLDDFIKLLKSNPDKKIGAILAVNLGFGPLYSSEICEIAGVAQDKMCDQIGFEDAVKIHKVIEVLDKVPLQPVIYDKNVSPFPLKILGDGFREMESFSDALDEFFSQQEIEIVKEEVKKTVEEQKEKIERIITKQDEAAEKWRRIEQESREAAETIYKYYSIVEGVLEGIKKAKDMGLEWDEIKKKIQEEGSPEAECIKEIREHDGVVVLNLGGKDIEIDIRKSVEENAEKYYEDAKWARRKLEGVEEAKEEHIEKLENLKPPEDIQVFEKVKPPEDA